MWFNVDDKLRGSAEVLAIPRRYRAAAMGVWVLCGTYASGQLTDGFVPDEIIKECGGTAEIRGWLIKACLWELADGGVTYTPRGCRVPLTQDVQKERVATAQRVRKLRAKHQNGADLGVKDNVTPLHPEPVTEPVTDSPGYGYGLGVTEPNLFTSQAVVTNRGTLLGPQDAVDPFVLGTAERGLSPPVKVGASRLVGTIIRPGAVNDADRTILRIEASALLAAGDSEEDVADGLRIWLTKTGLGAYGLKLVMAEVYKRKHAPTSTDLSLSRLAELDAKYAAQQAAMVKGELES